MSPRQRLEERIHTFSARLGIGSAVAELPKKIAAIEVPPLPSEVPYDVPNRGQRVFESYKAWAVPHDEKQRLIGELHARGALFNSYVMALYSVLPFGSQMYDGESFGLHGDIDACPLGEDARIHKYFQMHANTKPSDIPLASKLRLGVQPSYNGLKNGAVDGSLKEIFRVLSVRPTPVYAHGAKLWALHPSQGTTDDNYLFRIDMNTADLNPDGIPHGAEERVIRGWHRFLKLAGYDNVISIEPRLRRHGEVREYALANA